MKKMIFALTLTIPIFAQAQTTTEPKTTATEAAPTEWLLLAGLSQPILLRGGNVEVNYLTRNFVFEYSHGFALNLSPNRDFTMTDAERAQKLDIFLPYSTGGGIGYRFTPEFNVRGEVKVHRYEVTRGAEGINYTVLSVGVGAYYYWYPFGNQHFVVTPSVRFWPNVASTLGGNAHTFADGQVHKAHDFSLFVNISLGYRF